MATATAGTLAGAAVGTPDGVGTTAGVMDGATHTTHGARQHGILTAATATTVDSTAEPVAGEPVEAATSTEPAQEYTTDHTDRLDPTPILTVDLPSPLET